MEDKKTNKKSRNNSNYSDTSEKSSKRDKDDLSKEGSAKEKDGAKDSSDEDEVVNYPHQPPIQNGFVVFIHQLNLATSTKEKRTVVEWISDALKMLDVTPETITVDKMMEQSIVTCTKPKVPIIKFSKPVGKKQEDQENAPSFRFRTKNRKTSENEDMSESGSPSKPVKSGNTKGSQSKKKIKNDKSKTISVAPGVTGQASGYQPWKGAKLATEKSVNSTSSKGLQRKSGRPIKPHVIEDKKQEFGVQLTVLRDKCRTLQRENSKFVWVLLIESRRRCIVDMGKLSALASKFRFKVRWIPAQAPRSLDQSVFAVVNDIVQTKNICFPEQMKVSRRKDRDPKPDGKPKHGKQLTKAPHVEILHKTLSARFDVSSYASIEIAQFMDVPSPPIPNSAPTTEDEEPSHEPPPPITKVKRRKTKKPAPKPSEKEEVGHDDKPNRHDSTGSANADSNESTTSASSEASSSADTSSTRKHYDTVENTVVQLALITGKNPFSIHGKKTEVMGLNGFFIPSEFDPDKITARKMDDMIDLKTQIESSHRPVVVVIRDEKVGNSTFSTILKDMLSKDGIISYTIDVCSVMTQLNELNSVDNFLPNDDVDSATNVSINCNLLIQNELNKNLDNTKYPVIIVDVADESIIQMWSVYEYALKIGFKAFTLEKQVGGSFENNLKKVMRTIRRNFKQRHLADKLFRERIAAICAINEPVLSSTMETAKELNSDKIMSSKTRSICCMINHHTCKYPTNSGIKRTSSSSVATWKQDSFTGMCQLSKPAQEKNSGCRSRLLEAIENGGGKKRSHSCTLLTNHNVVDDIEDKGSFVESERLGITSFPSEDRCGHVTEIEAETNTSTSSLNDSSDYENTLFEYSLNENEETLETKTSDSHSFSPFPTEDTAECIPAPVESIEFKFLPTAFSAITINNNYTPAESSGTSRETFTRVASKHDVLDSSASALDPAEEFQVLKPRRSEQIEQSNYHLRSSDESMVLVARKKQSCSNLQLKPSNSSDNKPSNFTFKHWKPLFELHRNRKISTVTVSSTSDEELRRVWVALPNTGLENRKLRKGFFHKTHSRVTGFFRRVCGCGRKKHHRPKNYTRPKSAMTSDSFVPKRVRRRRTRKI